MHAQTPTADPTTGPSDTVLTRTAPGAGTPGAAVAGLYAALARGDVQGLVDALGEDVAWTIAAGLPYAGTYVGRRAVLGVFTRYGAEWDDLSVVPAETFAVGDVVIALGSYHARGRASGRPMSARFAHVWRFEDGEPVGFETIADTARMVAALRGA